MNEPSSDQQIRQVVQDSFELIRRLEKDIELIRVTRRIAESIIDCYRRKGKVLFCGNGGSAADAQHLSSELSGRYYRDRPPLFAEALHVNTSYVTAVSNDYSFDEIYSRLVRAMGRPGDILLCLSTSGNSVNVIKAMEAARSIGMHVVAFTGKGGGKAGRLADHWIEIPSTDTPRIQECHILLGHAICQIVEHTLFPPDKS